MESQGGVWQNIKCQQHVNVDGPMAPSEGPVSFTLSSSLVLETSRAYGNVPVIHQGNYVHYHLFVYFFIPCLLPRVKR